MLLRRVYGVPPNLPPCGGRKPITILREAPILVDTRASRLILWLVRGALTSGSGRDCDRLPLRVHPAFDRSTIGWFELCLACLQLISCNAPKRVTSGNARTRYTETIATGTMFAAPTSGPLNVQRLVPSEPLTVVASVRSGRLLPHRCDQRHQSPSDVAVGWHIASSPCPQRL